MTGAEGLGWSNQQLIELLVGLSSQADEDSALETALEHAVGAVEAEIGALVTGTSVAASIGFARGRVPEQALVELAGGAASRYADLPGVGICSVARVPVAAWPHAALIVARSGDEFASEEVALLRAMGRVLDLVVQAVRNLASERSLREQGEQQAEENEGLIRTLQERQDLLERLGDIQRLIAARAPLEEIIEAILSATSDLIGEPAAGLRLVDPAEPDFMDLVMAHGIGTDLAHTARRSRTAEGIGGRAITEGRLVVSESYVDSPERMEDFVRAGVTAAMAAPLLGPEGPLGSLVVSSRREGRVFTERDQTVLLTLAEHAKVALNDARTSQALRDALDAATHQAMHDELTGLPNRALFLDRLEHALHRARRTGSTLAVIFVDVDEFKLVNDSLGHDVGDVLLCAVAGRLESAVRGCDTAARLGGDEFALLLEDLEPADVVACADRVLASLREPVHLAGQRVLSRASLGIAVSTAGDRESGELLREADMAMYQAKAHGKDCCVTFEPAMQERVRRRMQLELDLHRALEREEFVLWYQPVVDLRTGAVTGLEALVRWCDPVRGLVPPAEFIPLAEETGLMVPLGSWILHEACRAAAGWREASSRRDPLCLAVNISARQMRDPGLVDDVRSALDAAGLPAAALKLELTESALISDTDAVLARMTELKRLGVALSIDDFGTGYSSLGYLRRFPVDELKIDKSFVDDLLVAGGRATLAEVVVALGESLHMRTVAEGVETGEQARMLGVMGCGQAQGFYFHRPMPAEDVPAVLGLDRARVP